ncbi:MAG TPA: methyltransferase domain-containing protein [Pyrinomonadaceae bacterium]|nr:methyltransferase domain-containing protein [Pyrinomonadaceae bacterium]
MPKPIYDKLAGRYEKALAPFERRFLSRWRRETISHLPSAARILEVGAGTGLNFPFYPPHQPHQQCQYAVASEISCRMLEVAARKPEAGNISLIQTDAGSLPFAANSFDAAFATLVFCSLSEPQKAFAELQRVAVDGGRIVLLEHVRPPGMLGYVFDGLNILTEALMEDHFNRRTAKLAEESGLKIVEVKQKAFGIVNLIVCEVNKV